MHGNTGGFESGKRNLAVALAGVLSIATLLNPPLAHTSPEAGATPTAAGAKVAPDKLAKGVADFHTQCMNSSQLNGLHECECLTEGYRERATRSGSTILSMKDQNALLQTCPASHEVTKAWVFQSCDAYMQHNRSDHVEFCNCTGDTFATRFRASPLSGLRQIEALRKESMLGCGLADKSHNLH